MSESLPTNETPHVTIIRPVKGLEPSLYECLAATFYQTYPRDKLTIYFCLSTRADPAYPVLRRLIVDFPAFDAKILVEDDDPALQAKSTTNLGPNPKIRNMSRAYREAKGDLVWIIDCNVWVGKGVAGRMVDKLCGFDENGTAKKFKFAHHLPLTIDITCGASFGDNCNLLNKDEDAEGFQAASFNTASYSSLTENEISQVGSLARGLQLGGGRLDEMFLSSAHAKFYTAINTLAIAPCIVGKSNMFRKSHLDSLTSQNVDSRPSGIDYFSHNICEDHLIGDLLWKHTIPEETGPDAEVFGKHAMVFGDLAIQPIADMSVGEYVARRVRWLRVRKFTVTLATLVEPGTESLLCSLYGAFAVTTMPWFHERLLFPTSWTAFGGVWFLSVILWAAVDWTLYLILHSMASVDVDQSTPIFARGRQRGSGRPFKDWALAWLGREFLALPIWIWAVFGGATVTWRGQKFRVGMDMRVHAIGKPALQNLRESANVMGSGKARKE